MIGSSPQTMALLLDVIVLLDEYYDVGLDTDTMLQGLLWMQKAR